MYYKVDELLLLENLTYLANKPPLTSIVSHMGETVKEYINSIDINKLIDNNEYAAYITGYDWKNTLTAIKYNKDIMAAKIIETHVDMAFGGGLGISAIFINEDKKEAVVAFRGTAAKEWTDDFLGANQIDSLQQINALEWYRWAYNKYNLKDYYITTIGHSKGGNKAKYITLLDNTINRCVSFDGQGFSDKFMDYYKYEIKEREKLIENHNIDYDYVNILMNDVGSKTFYIGFGYDNGGFMESHCPNTFFNFKELGIYRLEENPNGQRAEMLILSKFINSMIRSASTDKDRSKNNLLVGSLIEKAFSIGQEMSTADFINYLCDMIGDEKYVDNTAYLLSFAIKYSKANKEFLTAIKNIMIHFNSLALVNTINMIEDLVNSKKLNLLLGLSNFLVLHVNKIVVKKIQNIAKKKYDVELTKEQISKVLQIILVVRDKIKTIEINDGTSIDTSTIIDNDDEVLENLNIVVLAGGLSIERNISLFTGYMIYNELKKLGHNVILLDPYMGYSDEVIKIDDAFSNPDEYSLKIDYISDDLPDLWAVKKRRIYQSNSYFGPNVLEICNQSDLVFLALNGDDINNGKIQSTFDLLGIDYTGNDYYSILLATNKIQSKTIFNDNNIKTPKGYSLKINQGIKYPKDYNIKYPVIIKPNTKGIRLGINIATDDTSYASLINDALKWDNEIIIEEFIEGIEYSVSIFNNQLLPILEVIPLSNDKYNILDNKSKRCPAIVSDDLKYKLNEYTNKIYNLFNFKAYAKVNYIVRNNEIYCINVDSTPKLSPYSHLAFEANEYGINYSDFCSNIIKMSINK